MELNLSKTLVVGDYKSFGDPLYIGLSSFIEGLVAGNHEVLRFDVLGKRIGPCDDCASCNTNEFPCSYLDDFNCLASELLEAEAFVLFAEGDFSKALLNALAKFRAFSTKAKSKPHLKKVYLVYSGTESGEKKNFVPWIIALLSIAPGETQAFRFDAIGESENAFLKDLGLKL